MIISINTKMAEVIHHNFQLIPIISRFKINFGFGDKTVEEVCKSNNIRPDFFVEIVNAFNNPDYSPTEKLDKIPLYLIVDYLRKSHQYFNSEKLPVIEQLINQLEWENTNDQKNKEILTKFFNQYRKEVTEHTLNEEKEIYPYVLYLEECYNKMKQGENYKTIPGGKTIKEYQDTHDELSSALLDLKNIIIKYLQPSINSDITDKILIEIFRLEKDMEDHTRIEDTVLIPVAVKMEKELKQHNG
jgi:regulator of cell morphogenesis and NO signaling